MSLRDLVTIRTAPASPLRAELSERLLAGAEAPWSAVADFLRSSFEADHCVITLYHQSGAVEALAASGLSPDWSSRYEERFADQNPFVAEARRRRPQGGEPLVAVGEQLVPARNLRDTGFFREFFQPLGINDSLGALLF